MKYESFWHQNMHNILLTMIHFVKGIDIEFALFLAPIKKFGKIIVQVLLVEKTVPFCKKLVYGTVLPPRKKLVDSTVCAIYL